MSEVKGIACEISKGMFSDEVVVRIHVRGQDVSFFVPSEFVRRDGESSGRLSVQVVRNESQPWAIVPNESRTTIPVSEGDLVEA